MHSLFYHFGVNSRKYKLNFIVVTCVYLFLYLLREVYLNFELSRAITHGRCRCRYFFFVMDTLQLAVDVLDCAITHHGAYSSYLYVVHLYL